MPVYKDNKRGTWTCRFRKKDIYGNIKEKTKRGFKRKSDADSYERKELLNPFEEKHDLTFKELFLKYKDYSIQRLRESSVLTIEERMRKQIFPIWEKRKINSITLNDYILLQKELINKNLSISYINTIHANVSTILKFGQKFYDINKNVANLVGPLKDNSIKPQKKIWTPKEYELFVKIGLEYTKDNIKFKRILILLITEFILGLRIGETQGIQYKDIDFDKMILYITKSYSPREKKITSPKNKNSYRKIDLPISLLNLLKDCLIYDKCIEGFNDDLYVFGWLKPFPRTTIDRLRKNICEKANLEDITNHGLRHSQASYLTNSNINKQAVAEMLGHSPEILLTTYSHTYKSTNENLTQKQNELYVPKNI